MRGINNISPYNNDIKNNNNKQKKFRLNPSEFLNDYLSLYSCSNRIRYNQL